MKANGHAIILNSKKKLITFIIVYNIIIIYYLYYFDLENVNNINTIILSHLGCYTTAIYPFVYYKFILNHKNMNSGAL